MDIPKLKEYILENNKIPLILEAIDCHNIVRKNGYWTCGNHDGDNKTAITVYENDSLTTINYTRDITGGKGLSSDIFALVEFAKKILFFEAVKFVCDAIDLSYYHDWDEDIPESLRITKMIYDLKTNEENTNEDQPICPIPEDILAYYKNYVNDMFFKDGIDYSTQKFFGVGYDDSTNRITIPIRDEIGTLVGVKGRLFKEKLDEDETKYIYLEPCPRSKILYGLNYSCRHIRRTGKCFIGEAEKSCMQLWSMGYLNCVAIGGKKISRIQIDKLTRLCADLYFVFDKDVDLEELRGIADRFIDGVNIYVIYDGKNILGEKESPTDNKEKFKKLMETSVMKIK